MSHVSKLIIEWSGSPLEHTWIQSQAWGCGGSGFIIKLDVLGRGMKEQNGELQVQETVCNVHEKLYEISLNKIMQFLNSRLFESVENIWVYFKMGWGAMAWWLTCL